MIVIGIKKTNKTRRLETIIRCPSCHLPAQYEFIRTRIWFTYWLIPILPLVSRRSVCCTHCKNTVDLGIFEAMAASHGFLELDSDLPPTPIRNYQISHDALYQSAYKVGKEVNH